MSNKLYVEDVLEWKRINALLLEFEYIFPHLDAKIESYEEYSKKLEKYANVRLCKIDDEICGILVYYANDHITKTAYISLIGIHKQWQGKHIGRFLLEYCVEDSKRVGMELLKLEVDRDNLQAIKFYGKHGFVKEKEINCESFYMVKQLSD